MVRKVIFFYFGKEMMRILDNKNELKNFMYLERVKLCDKIFGYEKKNYVLFFLKIIL